MYGLEEVTPRKLLDIFSHPKLTRERISSHLQKFKTEVAAANGCAISQLKNWHLPEPCLDEMRAVSEAWRQPDFEGFSNRQISQKIRSIHE